MTAIRAYKIKLYGNKAKTDTALYTHNRFNLYVNMFMGKVFFRPNEVIFTAGLGALANRALRKSQGIVRCLYKSRKKTKNKINVPYRVNTPCPAKIEASDNSFDYWVRVTNQWSKAGCVRLPGKSHKALNTALRKGWVLKQYCEVLPTKSGLYALVFVSKQVKTNKPKAMLGVDVGMKHSIVVSDGYLGRGIRSVIRKQKNRHAERRRQGHKISDKCRSEVKQILDREAKIVLRRSQASLAGVAVESPNRLANLKCRSLQGWARSYFANRLHVLGQENGVMVLDINPYQTSQTCSKCGAVDKKSRVTRDAFCCTSCGYADHADKNAAVVIAQKGTQMLLKKEKSE